MTSFHATLNLTFDAGDLEEAAEIAEACKRSIAEYSKQPFKVDVDIDDIEEN